MLHHVLILLSMFTTAPSVSPTPLNGLDSIDSEDLTYIFDQLAITRARFALQPESVDYVLNPVLDEYQNGELVSSRSVIDTLTKQIPGYTADKARLVMKAMLAHLVVEDVERELRLYARQDRPTDADVTFSVEGRPMTFTFPIDTATLGSGAAHAFPYDGMVPGERVPLLSIYYVSKGDNFVDCPADADVATVAGMYHYVVIIYGEARILD